MPGFIFSGLLLVVFLRIAIVLVLAVDPRLAVVMRPAVVLAVFWSG